MRFGHRAALWDEYVDGVLDYVTVGTPSCGAYGEGSPRKCRELEQARRQGFRDAKDARPLRRHDFSRETVLRRVELAA